MSFRIFAAACAFAGLAACTNLDRTEERVLSGGAIGAGAGAVAGAATGGCVGCAAAAGAAIGAGAGYVYDQAQED